MKKLLKITILLTALSMAVLFMSCSGANASNDVKYSEPVIFIGTEDGGAAIVTYKGIFNPDDTFRFESAVNAYAEETDYEGTYTGNAAIDGEITITILKKRILRDLLDYTGDDAVQTLTITNGKFTFDLTEYTRQ